MLLAIEALKAVNVLKGEKWAANNFLEQWKWPSGVSPVYWGAAGEPCSEVIAQQILSGIADTSSFLAKMFFQRNRGVAVDYHFSMCIFNLRLDFKVDFFLLFLQCVSFTA